MYTTQEMDNDAVKIDTAKEKNLVMEGIIKRRVKRRV